MPSAFRALPLEVNRDGHFIQGVFDCESHPLKERP